MTVLQEQVGVWRTMFWGMSTAMPSCYQGKEEPKLSGPLELLFLHLRSFPGLSHIAYRRFRFWARVKPIISALDNEAFPHVPKDHPCFIYRVPLRTCLPDFQPQGPKLAKNPRSCCLKLTCTWNGHGSPLLVCTRMPPTVPWASIQLSFPRLH